jgi:hypothetical protein
MLASVGEAVPSVNLGVAQVAVPGNHTVARVLPPEGLKVGLGPPGMARGIVAALAELRGLSYKEGVVVAAVAHMAVQAIFRHRGMLHHKGPSFLRMALEA